MTDLQLEHLTIVEASNRLKRGEISPVELTRGFLNRIHLLNPAVNAYVTLTEESALEQAHASEKEIAEGHYRSPLHGIPFSIKDNIATEGIRTTAGSKILSQWKPDFDATVVQRLKTAGAIILGKTNMHEWALGGTTINPFYGSTHNPWDLERIAGGSSGGSAAAVASSTCMASIGTDSAQSVRNPAGMCGVVGLKATYGRVSRFGAVPGTGGYSTDHVGVLAKTVEDSSLVFEVIAGQDGKDPLSSDEPVHAYSKILHKEVKGLKVGILKNFYDELVASQVRSVFTDAVRVFHSLGMKTEEVSIPHLDLVPAVKLATSRPENACAHDANLRTRVRDYSPQILYSYICALLTPAVVYVNAQRVRCVICDEFDAVFSQVDLLALPTLLFPAPTIEECKEGYIDIDGKRVRRDSMGGIEGYCAVPFNLTGLPAISIPCGFSSSGLPIGMQGVGRDFQEGTVFQAAHAYERAAGWYKRRPDIDKIAEG